MHTSDGSPRRRRTLFAVGVGSVIVALAMTLPGDATLTDSTSAATGIGAPAAADATPQRPPVDAPWDATAPPARSAATDVEPEWLRHPFEVALEVHVCDASGRPVAGHVPVIAPAGGLPCSTGVASDEDGTAVVRLPVRRPEVCIELADPRGHMHTVRLRHDQPNQVALVLPATGGDRVSTDQLPVLGALATLHPHVRFEGEANATSRNLPAEPPVESPVPRVAPHPPGRGDFAILGTVHDVHGIPCVDVEVEWRSDDGTFGVAAHTDGDGAFVMRHLPAGPGLVIVHGLEGMAMPLASRAGVVTGDHDLRLVVSRASGSVLRVHAPHTGAAAGWLAVHDEATGFVAMVAADGGSTRGTWQIAHLRAGSYSVALHCPGLGRVPLGRHWLDGRATLDLGTAPPAHPCDVGIASAAGGLANALRLELVALRPDFDVLLAHRPQPGDRLLLAPGDYALFAAPMHGSQRLEPVRFTARAGESIVVPLPR